jgi:hypothetical protein
MIDAVRLAFGADLLRVCFAIKTEIGLGIPSSTIDSMCGAWIER